VTESTWAKKLLSFRQRLSTSKSRTEAVSFSQAAAARWAFVAGTGGEVVFVSRFATPAGASSLSGRLRDGDVATGMLWHRTYYRGGAMVRYVYMLQVYV
jgi:hypothetical protein